MTPGEFFTVRHGWLACAHLVLGHDSAVRAASMDAQPDLSPVEMRHLWTEALACQRREPLRDAMGTWGEVMGWLLRAWHQAVEHAGPESIGPSLWPLVAQAARRVIDTLEPLDAMPEPGARWRDRKDLEG